MTSTLTREPAHGTILEYVSFNCRCPLCQANWDANAARYYYGKNPDDTTRKVPADGARDHLGNLLDMGFDVAAIADAAGITRDTVRAIARGDQREMQRRTADAILAVNPDEAIPGHRVPGIIVRRMLGQMRACGLTLKWIYNTAGVNPKFSGNYSGGRVSWDNYIKLRHLYDLLLDSNLIKQMLKEDGDGAAS